MYESRESVNFKHGKRVHHVFENAIGVTLAVLIISGCAAPTQYQYEYQCTGECDLTFSQADQQCAQEESRSLAAGTMEEICEDSSISNQFGAQSSSYCAPATERFQSACLKGKGYTLERAEEKKRK